MTSHVPWLHFPDSLTAKHLQVTGLWSTRSKQKQCAPYCAFLFLLVQMGVEPERERKAVYVEGGGVMTKTEDASLHWSGSALAGPC